MMKRSGLSRRSRCLEFKHLHDDAGTWLKPGAWGCMTKERISPKAPRFSPYRSGSTAFPLLPPFPAIPPLSALPALPGVQTAFQVSRINRYPSVTTSSGCLKKSRQTRVGSASSGSALPNASMVSQPLYPLFLIARKTAGKSI
jgi:hypothetical protein